MKALTVQQPWAWAIVHGGKLIENRTQNWSYRGRLAIHAGARWSARGAADPRVVEALIAGEGGLHPDIANLIRLAGLTEGDLDDRSFGAILGIVDLVDAHPDAGCCKPWGESAYVEHGGRERRLITHLVLEDPRPLSTPIPCKGALGLWNPPAEVVARINKEVRP